MGPRGLVTLLLPLGIVVAPVVAATQSASKVARIGYLTASPASSRGVGDLRQGLRDLGYV